MHERIQDGALTEVTFLILLSLYTPNHGYGIMQFIKERTNNRVQLGPGTLYGALNTLEKKNWIVPINGVANGRKKQYLITNLGKEMVEKENKRMKSMLTLSYEITKEEM